MSYQVLARKWRPRFFDEMVGQEHVLKALINALNEQRLHHAYLFTGTRGVGKTTIARILAKCLNCEQGISARPCGECSACREIAEGRFVDLIEVDAASRTKVEDTRELLDNVQYAPTRGRFKVYLIDEVHMLSTHSFNALLKTLEEPPAHVKFLLATTDPQKLPVTVLSRCLQFSLKNMTPERIVSYLGKVLEAESVSYEEPALWQLGRAAQGSMRDALSLTDQAIAYGEGSVGEAQVNAMLGTMDRGRLFKLAEIMAKAEPADVLAEVASMAEHAPDYDEVLQGLMSVWHKAALGQVVPDAIDNAEGDRDAVLQLSMAMQPEDLQLYYQIALSGRSDLAHAPDPRQGFEMVLLRMLAFRPAPTAPVELDLTSALQKKKSVAQPSQINAQTAESVEIAAPTQTVATVEAADLEPSVLVDTESAAFGAHTDVSADLPTYDADDRFDTGDVSDEPPAANAVQEAEPASNSNDSPVTAPAADSPQALTTESSGEQSGAQNPEIKEDTAAAVQDLPLLPHTWWQWVSRLKLAGLPMAIARNSALIAVDGHQLYFDVDPVQGALFNAAQQQRIQDALQELLPGVSIMMQLQSPRGETPEQRRQREKAEAQYGARQAIDGDPLVQKILADFGANVLDDTVRPVS
ncbi:DNA polymerase III subunit gamma/tau [Thalassolituus sp. LLYu03]|uniref:DNA polymerase III subunit gamma/tau n=1 Tax=Thalassolituus sp. LLYu03 TaxID=3421656 RepID=UPI003D28AA33